MEFLKKLWENKMTRMYLLATGGLVLLILLIAILSSSAGSSVVNDKTLVNAAKSYINSNISLAPKTSYGSINVSLSTLVSEGYISEKKEGASCSSYVVVTNVDNEYYYSPYIRCNDENDTVLLRTKLLKTVVTSGPGLYNNNGEYIYRGEANNNYISINETLWRIMGLDENNNIKLVSEKAGDYTPWDDRYNSTLDNQYGINDYSLSRIKEFLSNYENADNGNNNKIFTGDIKSRMVKFDQCQEAIDIENVYSSTCSNYIENQLFGTIRVQDYINASLDTSCSYANTKNCQNYNFLNKNSWTASAYSGNNYEVYYIARDIGVVKKKASYEYGAYPVITLKSDIIYVSGNGTQADPYIVK